MSGDVTVRAEDPGSLAEYAAIPMRLDVRERVRVETLRIGARTFAVDAVQPPYAKDYDADEEWRPAAWASRFDLSRWAIFSAWIGGRRVGGAALCLDDPSVGMHLDEASTAVLWDLRVASDARRRGTASALFAEAATWARARDARSLLAETQDVNVPACRLYASRGCVVAAIDRGAYPSLPDEVAIVWRNRLR